ncbi:MAG: DUF4097 family beta strand repeat protein [Alphaproteobacteria bacterium]|nr:DUF4097 family beta strand repeat protein [Alphaproteobacteria bacterium]MCB9699939.1 DUF4097 family beta strand repeat protein [Alphaproteobacteria bacterium]
MWWMTTAALAATPFERTIDVPARSVDVEVICGALRIVGRQGPGVHVSGTLDSPDLLEVGAGRIAVSRKARHDACVDLTIEVPSDTALDVTSISADLSVTGVTGPLELESVSGSASVSGSPSRVELSTVSGAVTLAGAMAVLEVSSVSGPIVLDTTAPMSAVELSVVSGAITVSGPLAPQGHLEVSTHSGPITARLPADLDARLELATLSGRVRNVFGGREIVVGSGAGSVELATFSGPIALEHLAVAPPPPPPPAPDAPPPPPAPNAPPPP